MSESDTANLIYSLLLLVLVGSALISRALPIGQTIKMAFAWVGIFSLLFLLLSFRPEMKLIWQRVTEEIGLASAPAISGEPLTLRKSEDGHFWVNAEVNGRSVRFMIDSGATFTALSAAAARDAGIDTGGLGLKTIIETANGAVEAERGTIANLRVGSLQMADHKVVVAEAFGDTNVLGMNFLSELESWRVEGDRMILVPARSDLTVSMSVLPVSNDFTKHNIYYRTHRHD
ncbi:aspartyl protease family protein [Blastomonas natatoria]|uniref:Aspartyl protease family protein n=1 Tax=Blastomonas natatoria TaxID=34015 RepID=A0A2V3V0K6_9SPHN|nr:TIGR02281 family clan AA aspartic protease [Blastomonas natatoria]PXW75272.1 aspartyl protease family protein [Blastomonas natatoria]